MVRGFCSFLCEPAYRWPDLCERIFGEYPSQVCFAYNLPVHVSDNEAEPRRRALSRNEIQTLFDYFDDEVERLYAKNNKAWLTTLRDSCIAKIAYGYGLRRQELLRLQIQDFGPNPHVPQHKGYGAVYVRYGKGSRGSAHKRRTVLTVPLMDRGPEVFEAWVGAEGEQRDHPYQTDPAALRRTRDVRRVAAIGDRPQHVSGEFCGVPISQGAVPSAGTVGARPTDAASSRT